MAEHSFQVSEEDYQIIADAARERGQSPDDLVRAWVAALRQAAAGEAIDPDQAWFWTPEWQAKEREADADLAAGNFTRYDSDEEFLRALDED
jgi:hypothetical protein